MIRRLLLLGVLAALVLGAAVPVAAQPPASPVKARLVLRNPPADVTYGPTQPIEIVVEVFNDSGAQVVTTEGFSRAEFWRRLFFTDPNGGTITNTGQPPHEVERTFFCLSRNRVLQRPTAVPVVPVEVLEGGAPPAGFFVSYTIDDARKYYDLTRPGRYTVDARVPLQTFEAASGALFGDCDQLPESTVADVTAVTGRRAFTAVSNTLELVIGSPLQFGGFQRPLVGDGNCPSAAVSPCVTLPLNRAVWIEFQLADGAGAPVTTAQPRILLTKVGGGTATLKNDRFEYHAGQREYRYLLHTRGLTDGVWRLDVFVDIDRSVHSAHFGLSTGSSAPGPKGGKKK